MILSEHYGRRHPGDDVVLDALAEVVDEVQSFFRSRLSRFNKSGSKVSNPDTNASNTFGNLAFDARFDFVCRRFGMVDAPPDKCHVQGRSGERRD